MIYPHWELVDLDPHTWRAIGRFINPGLFVRAGSPDEHALYVLHDQGRVLNIVDTERGRRSDLAVEQIRDPRLTADRLFNRGEWDRVHVIDRSHLAAVSTEAQSDPRHEITLDAYFRFVYHQLWDNEGGYVSVPGRPGNWNGWTYQSVANWITQLPNPSSIAIGVIGESELEIGIIAIIENALVRKVTTFEALPIPREDAAVTASYRDRLWDAIAATFAPPAALLLCTESVFEQWIEGPNKSEILSRAVVEGAALIRSSRTGP